MNETASTVPRWFDCLCLDIVIKYMKTLLLIVVVAGLVLIQLWPRIDGWMDKTDYSSIKADTVIVFSTGWCKDCKKVMEFFDARGIKYTEHDVEKSERGKSEFEQLGGVTVPFTLIGSKTVDSFDTDAILKALQSLPGVVQ